jgi:hypothetical protein
MAWVEMKGLEPLISCMRSNHPELPNLLKLLELIDLTTFILGKIFHIFADFGIFWNHFHTRIHTRQINFSGLWVHGIGFWFLLDNP